VPSSSQAPGSGSLAPHSYPKDIDQSIMVFPSEEIAARKLPDAFEVDQAIFNRINAAYGTDFKLQD